MSTQARDNAQEALRAIVRGLPRQRKLLQTARRSLRTLIGRHGRKHATTRHLRAIPLLHATTNSTTRLLLLLLLLLLMLLMLLRLLLWLRRESLVISRERRRRKLAVM